jgi:hypothetical protein
MLPAIVVAWAHPKYLADACVNHQYRPLESNKMYVIIQVV